MNELDQLPTIEISEACVCGNTDVRSCNIDDAGQVVECNECTWWDEAAQVLRRKNLQ